MRGEANIGLSLLNPNGRSHCRRRVRWAHDWMTGDACREVGFGAGLLEMTSFGSLCARPIPENGSRICLLTVGDSLTAPNTRGLGLGGLCLCGWLWLCWAVECTISRVMGWLAGPRNFYGLLTLDLLRIFFFEGAS